MRCAVDNVAAPEKLLTLFFGYARPEVAEFRKAVTRFNNDRFADYKDKVVDLLARVTTVSIETQDCRGDAKRATRVNLEAMERRANRSRDRLARTGCSFTVLTAMNLGTCMCSGIAASANSGSTRRRWRIIMPSMRSNCAQ
jgi:hypothetical protein